MESLNWETKPQRTILGLAWPIALSMLSYSTMTLVDTLLVGGLGASALAGVGLGGTAAFALLCFSFGLLRGVKALVSQALGAGRTEETGAYLGAALAAAAVLGLATVVAGQFVAELLRHLAATETAGQAARDYLHIRNLGAPAALAYVALREVCYARGDTRSPMWATIAANVINIALALLFVFVLGWGVAGAAAATVIAHVVEFALLALLQQRAHGFALSTMRMRHIAELWQIGLPTGLQFTLEIGAFALLAGLIGALSETEMAAHQIALQVIHFSFLPTLALGEAASVLASRAVGADRDGLVLVASRAGMKLTMIYTGIWTAVLALLAPVIVTGFRVESEVAQRAIPLLYVAAAFQLFDGVNIIGRAVLRGTGDARYAAWIGVASSWVCTPPLTWLLGYRLGLGALGGWLGLLAETAVGAFLLWRRLERRDWIESARAARARLAAAEPTPFQLEPAQ